jgi:hypothetical protein
MGNLMLQAEMSHLASIYGPSGAEAELNERLADLHEENHTPDWVLSEETGI